MSHIDLTKGMALVQNAAALSDEIAIAIFNGQSNWDQTLRSIELNAAFAAHIENTGDATLRRDDWVKMMSALTKVRQRTQVGLSDLREFNLISGASLTETIVEVENVNEYMDAKVIMNGTAQTANQSTFASSFTALPLYVSGWFIRYRQGLAYRNQTGLTASGYQVLKSQNNVIFNGAPSIQVPFNGVMATIYGYFTHPDRQTTTITDWTDLATNGDKIISDTLKMIDLMFRNSSVDEADSVMMYVADDIWTNLQEDYSTQKDTRTFYERLKAISQIKDVKPSSHIASKQVGLVQMTAESVEYVEAQEVTTVPHLRTTPISDQAFTTFAAGVPIIKTDRNGATGIVTAGPP
jgi:hypothetical protein